MSLFLCRYCGEFKFFTCASCENLKLYFALVGTHEERERNTDRAWWWWTNFLRRLHDSNFSLAIECHELAESYARFAESAEDTHRRYLRSRS